MRKISEGTIIIERDITCPDFPYTVYRFDGDGHPEYVDSCPDFPAAERLARCLDRLWRA